MSSRSACTAGLVFLLAGAVHAGPAPSDCGWVEFTAYPVVSNAPDTNTRVYQAIYSVGPAHETVVRGVSPEARYFSFAALDPVNREIGNLSDFEIGREPDGSYEIHVRLDCTGADNCLEVGGGESVPGARMFYRIYVPDGDAAGGVGLPTIEYRGIDSPEPALAFPVDESICQTLLLATADPLRPEGAVGSRLAASTGTEPSVAEGETGEDPEPRRYDGPAGNFFDNTEERFDDAGLPPEVGDAMQDARHELGGGATADNHYVTMNFNIRDGNVRLRAKAPTYRKQHDTASNDLGRADGSEQVRYWSLCTTQDLRPVDCLRDENVVVDDGDFFEAIIAPECPVAPYNNCLRSGAAAVSGSGGVNVLFYRNLLAADDFANERGPHECPSGESEFCGDYELEASYVPRP